VELYIHSCVCMMWCLIKCGDDNFTFYISARNTKCTRNYEFRDQSISLCIPLIESVATCSGGTLISVCAHAATNEIKLVSLQKMKSFSDTARL